MARRERLSASVALLLLLGGCSSTEGAGDQVVPVVVDTDVGQDDAMALLLLLQDPAVRIEAITVSGTGLAHCAAGVRNVLALLDVAGERRELPVSCGPQEPLPGTSTANGAFPDEWRAQTDGFYGVDLPDSDRSPADEPAPALLRTAIANADGPVRMLTLGPLTNVALALREDPELVEGIERIVTMGGAVDVPGNAIENPLAEFNIWVDPVAAEEVFRSGAEIDLIPLDATQSAPVTAFFAEVLADHRVTPEAELVHSLIKSQQHLLEGGYFFWDPVAAAVLVDRSLATFEEHRITVLEGKPTIQGWTVHDAEGAPIHVATDADGLAFERVFLNTLNGDHHARSTRPEPVASATISASGCRWEAPSILPAGIAAVSLDAPPNASMVLAVVALLDGRTLDDLDAWLTARDHVVRSDPPAWIGLAAFLDPRLGSPIAVPLEPGPHGVVCIAPTGHVEVVGWFDVPA